MRNGRRKYVLTAEEISKAKKRVRYATKDVLHEHDDCIRIACKRRPRVRRGMRGP